MNFKNLPDGKSTENQDIIVSINDITSENYLYLLAGVHGDEPEGIYVLSKVVEWLKGFDDKSSPLSKIPIIVIPTLNIDGYRNSTRTNSNGVDLNRNLPSTKWTSIARESKYNPGSAPLSEVENIFMVDLFKKYKPGFIISFHSWKPMINYNGDCKDEAELMSKYNNYVICDDIENHPTPGSLGEYAPEKYSSPVITFEFPVLNEKNSLESIWLENEKALKALLTSEQMANRF